MIVNMPANTTSGHSPNTLPTSTPSTSCIANTTSTQCEYNFLKRKLDGEQSTPEGSAIVNISEGNVIEYENSVSTTQVWKKRHIQENSGNGTDTGCFNSSNATDTGCFKSVNATDTECFQSANALDAGCFKSGNSTDTGCFISTNEYNSYPGTHDETMLMDPLQAGNVQNELCVSTSATNTTTTTTNNSNNNNNNINNNNNSSSNDSNKTNISDNYNNNNNNMTFNLINNNNNNSSFINDIFAYDANLIVPVSASLVSHNTNNSATILPTFATPTNVCVSSANYDDANNWQATDLLELDHRYNSGLQTEIAHLQPTVPLKATEELTLTTNNCTPAQGQVQEPTQSISQTQFLVAEQQISRSTINTQQSRCRQSAAFALQTPQIQQQALSQTSSAAISDADADFEDRNLSWLLNFKFDEFPHLSPELGGNNNNSILVGGQTLQLGTQQQSKVASPSSSQKSNCCSPQSLSTLHSATQQSLPDFSRFSKSSSKASKKFEELVMEVTAAEVDGNEMTVAESVTVGNSPQRASKKPPFTYTELIEYALEDKGELTVSGIYQWISDRFPYYKSNDDRWKNSVRHNLSINPHFRKGHKAPQGAGHLWTISSGDSAENILAWEHKKQRLDLFFKMESINRERLQRLTCSSPHPDCQQHRQKQQQRQEQQQQQQQCVYDEAAIAAAAITREMLNGSGSGTEDGCGQNCNNNNQRLESTTHLVHELPFNDLMSDEELRKTAGQILNGIHREVEVQSVNSIISNYHDVLLDNEDYLNPIHKDVAVQESGLRSTNATHLPSASYLHSQSATSSQYYVTEIDPMELGIQMSHQVGAEEVLFSDEFNLNYFGYNGANDIVA